MWRRQQDVCNADFMAMQLHDTRSDSLDETRIWG